MSTLRSNSSTTKTKRSSLYDSRTSTVCFILVGLLFHVISIMSIFDIYFRSPVIEGLEATPPPPNSKAPSSRVIFFIADGLRADTAFEKTEPPRMPFIHSKIENDGIWGVSHTRVPTESRPGHVAMFAGIYEDPSSVTEGWKKNKVRYDHVLRQAKNAFTIGAPEIVDLFPGPRVEGQHYCAEDIDFATNGEDLDSWSFKELHNLFSSSKDRWTKRKNAPTDTVSTISFKEKEKRLKTDGLMVMVHLLGLDTNGHAFLPSHKKYKANASFVDKSIREAVKEIESYYSNDGRTTYIFTSDHGMSDSGTHGDGDPNCTRCPFVAWGSGIDSPKRIVDAEADRSSPSLSDKKISILTKNNADFMNDSYTTNWSFSSFKRRDILQADICPTIATLLNVAIPANSIGTLRSDIFSSTNTSEKMMSFFTRNLTQLLRNLQAKEEMVKKREPERLFRPSDPPTATIEAMISEAKDDLDVRKIYQIIQDSTRYYQRYDWAFLRITMTFAYVGWMFLSFTSFIKISKKRSLLIRVLVMLPFAIGATYAFTLLKEKSSPPQYYAYIGFALCFWFKVAENVVFCCCLENEKGFPVLEKSFVLDLILYIAGIQSFVVVFFWREVLGPLWIVGVAAMTQVVPVPSEIIPFFLAPSVFPLLPPISSVKEGLYRSGWIGMLMAGALGILRFKDVYLVPSYLLLVASYLVCHDSDLKFANGGGGSDNGDGTNASFNQICSWFIVIASLASTFLLRQKKGDSLSKRFFSILLTLSPMYVTFSIAFEPLFYLSLGVPFVLLFDDNQRSIKGTKKAVSITRRIQNRTRQYLFMSWIFLLYLFVSFFGTGNFASISSFALPSVYRLKTVFEPFIMGALLLVKIMVPVVVLSAAFGCWLRIIFKVDGDDRNESNGNGNNNNNAKKMFMVVIGSIDLMTLNFFFLVKDEGSWLEIGSSISHFVICSVFSVIVLLVYFLSNFLLTGSIDVVGVGVDSDVVSNDDVVVVGLSCDVKGDFNGLHCKDVNASKTSTKENGKEEEEHNDGGRVLRSSSLRTRASKLPLPSTKAQARMTSNTPHPNHTPTPSTPRRETMLKPGNNSRY